MNRRKLLLIIAIVLIIGSTMLGSRIRMMARGGTTAAAESESVIVATYVIAANDSLAATKSKADYTADGTADDVQIQAAHDALPAGGGSIYLAEGTFNLASAVTFTKPVHLFGAGWATVVNSAVNGVAFQFGNGTDRLNGPKASNFRLVGNTGANAVGLLFIKTDFMEIESMWVRNFGAAGIKLNNALENPRVHDNNIDSLDSFTALGTEYGIHLVGTSHDLIIANNQIEGWAVGIYGDDDTTDGSADTIIRDNGFDDCDDYAIELHDHFISTSIVGNGFGNSTNASGFLVRIDYTNLPVSGTWQEIATIINDNYFLATAGGGVHITNGEGHTISGNVFQSVDGQPIKLDQSSAGNYTEAAGAVISGNTVQTGQTLLGGYSAEINVNNFDEVHIVNNRMIGQTGQSLTVISDRAVISGNIIRGANRDAGATKIISFTGQHSIISNNVVSGGTVTDSIVEEATSDYNLIHDNITDDGISTSGANTVTNNNLEV